MGGVERGACEGVMGIGRCGVERGETEEMGDREKEGNNG